MSRSSQNKICYKCNFVCSSNGDLGTHEECGGDFAWWTSRVPDLLKKFIQRCRGYGDTEMEARISNLAKYAPADKKGTYIHPGFELDWVLQKMEMAALLFDPDLYTQYIQVGFYYDQAIRLYLILSCIDTVGKGAPFQNFSQWVSSSEDFELILEQTLPALRGEGHTAADEWTKRARHFLLEAQKSYERSNGVTARFRRFFADFTEPGLSKLLTRHCWIGPVKRSGNGDPYADQMSFPAPESWTGKNEKQKLDKIATFLANEIRSPFTHQGTPKCDSSEKGILHSPFSVSHITRIVHEGTLAFAPLNTPAWNQAQNESGRAFNNIFISPTGPNSAICSAADQDALDKLRMEFIATHPRIEAPDDQGEIFSENGSKVFCFRGISLTSFLEDLVFRGLAAKFKLLSDRSDAESLEL